MNFIERFQTRRVQKRIPFVLGSSTSYSDWIRKHPESQRQGILYLIENESFDSYKIGITRQASKSDRIEEHLKEGWKPVQTWVLDDLVIAEAIEQSVLDWWRHGLGTKPSVVSSAMPQGGFTETIGCQKVELSEILEFIEQLCSQKIMRPAVNTNLSNLSIGVRSVISAKVTHAKLGLHYKKGTKGRRQERWVYRYLISDGSKSAVVESHLGKKSPTKANDHEKLPSVGSTITLEGRPHLVFNDKYDFGFIDPYVKFEPESVHHLERTRCTNERTHSYSATYTKDKTPIWKCGYCGHETYSFRTGISCGICNRGEIKLWSGEMKVKGRRRPHGIRVAKCTRCRHKVPWGLIAFNLR